MKILLLWLAVAANWLTAFLLPFDSLETVDCTALIMCNFLVSGVLGGMLGNALFERSHREY